MVNEKVRNCWWGINELYGLYLLHHANGKMHVYLITSSITIITKWIAVAVYQFNSVRMFSCWDFHERLLKEAAVLVDYRYENV